MSMDHGVLCFSFRARVFATVTLGVSRFHVRVDMVSGLGHRAAVRLVNFTLTAFRQSVQARF
jgi:hypothetical protein